MSKQVFNYDKNSLLADYAKSMVGIILTASPILFLDLMSWLQIVFIICLILFVIFGIRTYLRQKSSYILENKTLHQTGFFPRSLNLDALALLNIRYFSTRKTRDAGWFQLKIIAEGQKVVVDSSLNGFDNLIEIAAEAAHKNNLSLDAITSDNMAAILKKKRS